VGLEQEHTHSDRDTGHLQRAGMLVTLHLVTEHPEVPLPGCRSEACLLQDHRKNNNPLSQASIIENKEISIKIHGRLHVATMTCTKVLPANKTMMVHVYHKVATLVF
jgi:hypothetical protein